MPIGTNITANNGGGGDVKTVCSKIPDGSGNIDVNADDVRALGKTGNQILDGNFTVLKDINILQGTQPDGAVMNFGFNVTQTAKKFINLINRKFKPKLLKAKYKPKFKAITAAISSAIGAAATPDGYGQIGFGVNDPDTSGMIGFPFVIDGGSKSAIFRNDYDVVAGPQGLKLGHYSSRTIPGLIQSGTGLYTNENNGITDIIGIKGAFYTNTPTRTNIPSGIASLTAAYTATEITLVSMFGGSVYKDGEVWEIMNASPNEVTITSNVVHESGLQLVHPKIPSGGYIKLSCTGSSQLPRIVIPAFTPPRTPTTAPIFVRDLTPEEIENGIVNSN